MIISLFKYLFIFCFVLLCTFIAFSQDVNSVNGQTGNVTINLEISENGLFLTGGDTVALPIDTVSITEIVTGIGLIGGASEGIITIDVDSSNSYWNANSIQGLTIIDSVNPGNKQILRWDENLHVWYPSIDDGSPDSRQWELTSSGFNLKPKTNSFFVGIGTASFEPDAVLTVNGKIHVKELKVNLTVPGPDYVFDKDYKLMSLSELEDFIQQNKHLPEIPSASEMQDSGIGLSEMNMKILKKVEELTLYVIDHEKRLKQLEE